MNCYCKKNLFTINIRDNVGRSCHHYFIYLRILRNIFKFKWRFNMAMSKVNTQKKKCRNLFLLKRKEKSEYKSRSSLVICPLVYNKYP